MNDRKELSMDDWIQIAKVARIPISCIVELTDNCNFHCPHCYIKETGNHFLHIEQFREFVVQFCNMGGKYLTLTGGEVLVHPEFKEMYKYAHRSGLAISVFSNGYLIDEEIVNLFTQYPPQMIDITLYGACSKTYQVVSRAPDAYERVTDNIQLLVRKGIPVCAKMTLFKDNVEDFMDVRRLVEKMEVPFDYSYALFPKLGGERSNLCNQISSEQAVEIQRSIRWEQLCKRKYRQTNVPRENMFICSAARSGCYLNSKNELRICPNAAFSSLDMGVVSFADAWKNYEKYAEMKPNKSSKCISCENAYMCDICPIWGYVMTNDVANLGKEVELHCSLTEAIVKRIELEYGESMVKESSADRGV